jgi:hypothetical protein
MSPRVPPGCSLVTRYLWSEDEGETFFHDADALDYWPLYPGEIPRDDGRKGSWIVVYASFEGWPPPTHEALESGEIRPIPRWGGEPYFNRSRMVRRGA